MQQSLEEIIGERVCRLNKSTRLDNPLIREPERMSKNRADLLSRRESHAYPVEPLPDTRRAR